MGEIGLDERVVKVEQDKMAAYLAAQADVVIAYLFGSVARGDATLQSDVDVAVLLEEDKSERQQIERQYVGFFPRPPGSPAIERRILWTIRIPCSSNACGC